MTSNNLFKYSNEFELLLKQEGERTECFAIMHLDASKFYFRISNCINIPVIALSSFIGFFTALQLFPYQNIILGCLGIGVSILKTVDSYFDITKKSETHRLTSLRYSKLSKLIQVQLSLPRSHRIDAKDLYYIITNDISNLKDSEPIIPDNIIDLFKKKYSNENTTKPSICNGLTNIKIFNENFNEEMQEIKPETKSEIKSGINFEHIDFQIEKKSERNFINHD
jgi:hypothetical protein